MRRDSGGPSPRRREQAAVSRLPTWRWPLLRWLSPAYAWRRTVHKLPQKLGALVVAMLVWLVATADRRANVAQGFDVPLEVRDTTGRTSSGRSSERAVSGLPTSVRVTLSGTRSRLQALQAGSIEASVDTTGAPDGSFTLPVEVRPPDGTRTLRVLPARLQGFVDSQLSRAFVVTLGATPTPGGVQPKYSVTPQQAVVSGPGRLVKDVAAVITPPVRVAAGGETRAALIALSRSGVPLTDLTIRPTTVSVRRSDVATLPLRSLPVVLPAPPPGLALTNVTVSPATVRVVGPAAALATLRSLEAVLTYKVGTATVTPSFRLPPGVGLLDRVSVSLTVQSQP